MTSKEVPPESGSAVPAEVRLTDETGAWLEEKMAAAVREGIKAAMTEETAAAFWAAGLTVLQKSATQRAGRFVLPWLADSERGWFCSEALGAALRCPEPWRLGPNGAAALLGWRYASQFEEGRATHASP